MLISLRPDRSLEDAYFGVGALTLLGAKGELQAKALCSLAASELAKEAVDVAIAFYAAHILGVAQCVVLTYCFLPPGGCDACTKP